MQLVEQALIFPGECALIASATGPFIDTHKVDALEKRIYVSIEALNELDRIALDAGAGQTSELIVALHRTIDEQAAELVRLTAVEAELAALKASVRRTLEAGAGGVQSKDGTTRLRPVPGQKAVRV
jgi:hypothetical protein